MNLRTPDVLVAAPAMRACRLLAATILLVVPVSHGADPAGSFRSWSAFQTVEVEQLAAGKIVTQCNASMRFARGISAQAAYLVAAPLETSVALLLAPDPSSKELDVYQHRSFLTERAAEFGTLKLNREIVAIGRLLEAMEKPDALHLTDQERRQLRGTDPKVDARGFWASVLRERWSRFASRGDLGGTSAYDARSEIASLLHEEPKVAQHFSALLAPLTHPGAITSPVAYYWDNSKVNNTAALELGARYSLAMEGRRQILDVTYYASSGYLAALTLFELVPVTVTGDLQTLVLEACLVSSPELAGGFGLKRKIAASIMTKDLEDSVRLFQHDATASARVPR